MKRITLVIVLLLAACAHMPQIQAEDPDRQPRIKTDCQSHFLQGRWQLVHTIFAHLDGGRQATFTGVIVLSPADASIQCVLMTLEGFVLFEAVDHGGLSVLRAFGPFANDHFARGIMDDIRFLFFEPDGGLVTAGRFEDGAYGCRYQAARNRTVDLAQLADGDWRMQQYNQFGYPLRAATAESPDAKGLSHRLTLEARGRHAYRLSMRLVEAVPIP